MSGLPFTDLTALTADEWILREIGSLVQTRDTVRSMKASDLTRRAAREETRALIDLSNANDESPETRLTLLWVAGRHALHAKIYRAAARAALTETEGAA